MVERPPGGGPAAARNAGARRARGELVAFVDADVEVHPEALERLRAGFATDPDAAAVFGSYDDTPAAPGMVSRFRNLLHHRVHSASPGPAESFWAGLGAVRRDDFEAVGGFDARRYREPSIEDIELGVRLRATGRRIVLDPRIRGTHLKRWTLASMVRTDLLGRGIPWVRLMLETRRAPAALNLAWRHRIGALAALATTLAALARRPFIALAGLGAVVASDPGLYALLRRRGGIALALAGLPLHVLHHLVAIAAALAGGVLHLLRERP